MKFGALFSSLFVAALCFGQKVDSFDMKVADYRLLLSRKVQAECGVNEAQRARLNKVADQEKAKIEPYLAQVQKEGRSQDSLRTDKTYLGMLDELRLRVLEQLSLPQLKRLRELTLQSIDIRGILNVTVADKIGMSAAQLKKVRDIFSAYVKASTAIIKDVNQGIASKYKNTKVQTQAEAKSLNDSMNRQRDEELKKHKPQFDKLEKETKRDIDAVLSAKQLAAYQALQGKPFNPK